jgi:hypothetical protein
MRGRVVDLALVAGLVIVAGGIMWTLFNLGSTPVTSGNRTSTVIVPVPEPNAARTTTPAATPATPAGSAAASATATPTPAVTPAPVDAPAATTPAATSTPATAAAPAARTLPEGVLALERVGFSFVTGGAGACGMVLEAWTHVAVSRDLLASYGCGATVRVTLDDTIAGRTEVLAVIGDTMNPSFTRTVNIYVGTNEPAIQYGLTTGTFASR